jgi:hypothetical protein
MAQATRPVTFMSFSHRRAKLNAEQDMNLKPLAPLAVVCIVGVAVAMHIAAGVHHDPTITLTGGHGTDHRDHGRPIALIAAGLGVTPEVFREAFSHVKPAPAGLDALGKYGVTNDDLDRVSNYYRYNRSRGEIWPTKPAVISAKVSNGVVTGFIITDGGAGFSSPPAVTVEGYPYLVTTVTLAFGKDLHKNGSISAVTVGAK